MPPLYDLYAMAHMAPFKKAKAFSEDDLDHPESFTNISSHNKLVMLSGDGRKHGSVAIGDELICCPSSLLEIKKCHARSLPDIAPRPQPVDLAIELRAHELLAEANRQAKERETELEQRTARMLEEERNRNDASHWALYELLVVSFS